MPDEPHPVGTAGRATGGARAPWRLRSLPVRQQVVAGLVVALLAVPFVAALVRAGDVGWNPSNDDALIALRVHDVLDGSWPLVGQPSTAEHYASGTETLHHPGPIQFYLFAGPAALVGFDLGMPLAAAACNLTAVVLALWALLRRAGPAVALGGSVLFATLAWSQGPVQLVDPISSNMGGIPLLALAVLAWAVVEGDLRLLPATAFVFAFVAQQHLALVGMAGGLALWTGVGVVLAVVAWRRSGEARPWAWISGAVAVTFVAWLPVLVDQVAGSGNLGRIATFAGSSDRPTLGLLAGIRQVVRAVGVPPLWVRTDLTGDDLHVPLSVPAWLAGLAVLGALLAIAVGDRHRSPARSRLAATALVVALLGAVTGSNVPASVEAARLNLYRWTFVLAVLVWCTLGWAAADAVRRSTTNDGVGSRAHGLRRAGVVLAGAALVSVTVAAVVWSGPQRWRDQEIFAAEEALSAAMLDAVAGHERVLLVPVGVSAEFAVAPALALDLVDAGHVLRVPPSQQAGYGEHLVATEPGAADVAVVVVSGLDETVAWPGAVVGRADLNAATREVRAVLADQLRSQELVPSAQAEAVLRDVLGDDAPEPVVDLFREFLAGAGDDPEGVLRHPLTALALRAGYFDARFDAEALAVLERNPPVLSWTDDVVEVRVLTAEELVEHWDLVARAGLGRPVA